MNKQAICFPEITPGSEGPGVMVWFETNRHNRRCRCYHLIDIYDIFVLKILYLSFF